MEDLAEQLKNILNSPEGQKQLQNIAQMIGRTDKNPGGIDLSSLMQNAAPSDQSQNDAPAIDMNLIANIGQMMKNMNTNDKNTQLLLALKPHFGERRQARVDRAIKMIRLFSLLPLLRQSGILSEFEL